MTVPHHFRWTVGPFMDAHGVTRYALEKHSQLSMTTIRSLYDGSSGSVHLGVLERLIVSLEALSGQSVPLTALLHRDAPAEDLEAGPAGFLDA